jgi:hypothetical protein
MMKAIRARHDIKRRIRKRQTFAISLNRLDLVMEGPPALATDRKHPGDEIHAPNLGPRQSRCHMRAESEPVPHPTSRIANARLFDRTRIFFGSHPSIDTNSRKSEFNANPISFIFNHFIISVILSYIISSLSQSLAGLLFHSSSLTPGSRAAHRIRSGAARPPAWWLGGILEIDGTLAMCKSIVIHSLTILSIVWATDSWAQPTAEKPPAKSETVSVEGPAVAAERLAEQLKRHPVAPVNTPGALPVYLLDTRDGQVTRIAGEVVPGLVRYGAMDWSHDGKRIVFDVARVGNQGGQWLYTQVVSIEQGDDRPLIRELGPGCAPSVTSGGDKIVFMLYAGMGEAVDSRFWIMNTDGSERAKLEAMGRPKVAPGNRFCLVTSHAGRSPFQLVDLSTGIIRAIALRDRQFFSIPSWADQQTFVAITGAERGDFVSLIDVSNPEHIRIKEDLWVRKGEQQFKPRSPVYSPETGMCVFIGRENGHPTSIYWTKKGQPRKLEHFESVTGNDIEGIASSPAGRYVVFSSDDVADPKK